MHIINRVKASMVVGVCTVLVSAGAVSAEKDGGVRL